MRVGEAEEEEEPRLDFAGMARGNREVFKHASVMRQGNS